MSEGATRDDGHPKLEVEVREELHRILASPSFALSQRHRDFLSFIVEETIAGRADRIKAYTIATSALGRGADFDAQRDSIVRIEAGRLRRELERYYLTEGAGAKLRIEIPKGAYVPQFVSAEDADRKDAPEKRSAKPYRGPRLFVVPFDRDTESDVFPGFERAFTRQVISGLTHFTTILVYGPETVRHHGAEPDLTALSSELDVDHILTGTVSLTAGRLTVDLLLQEVPEGRFVWAERFERVFAPADLQHLRDEIASLVVQRIAQPSGVLHSRSRNNEGEAPRNIRSYLAVMAYHEFFHTYEIDRIDEIRAGLELAIKEDPGFAEAFACLAMIITYSVRYGSQPVDAMDAELARAIKLAKHALLIAPLSSRAHHALGMALWFSGEVDESLHTYRTALALNPFDTEIMAELALRYALQMDWAKALPLIEDSYRRNPIQPDAYHMVPFLYHLAEGQPEEALKHARRISASNLLYGHLALAASAALTGQHEFARQAVESAERLVPDYGRQFFADARSRNLHPVLAKIWAEALHIAGMKGVLDGPEPLLHVVAKHADSRMVQAPAAAHVTVTYTQPME